MLDSAIDELSDVDRSAVVLRFLERRPFVEIGTMLRLSEDAARMRTDRALDNLRAALARRGITSTTAALGALVSSQPLISAPAGLAATLATHSLAASGAGLFGASLISFMTTKLITTALLSAFVAVAGGTYVGFKHEKPFPVPTIPTVASNQSDLIASLDADNKRL
jgi:xanthine/uracil/vitamin C permease (AzgA family)